MIDAVHSVTYLKSGERDMLCEEGPGSFRCLAANRLEARLFLQALISSPCVAIEMLYSVEDQRNHIVNDQNRWLVILTLS